MWNDVRMLNIATGVLAAVFVLILAGGAVAWGMHQRMFDLRGIVVRGDIRHLSLPAIRASAVAQLRGNFFSIDLGDARRAFETVPWVRRATVSRRWPNQLVVEIEEHVPMAHWIDGRGVNTHGELFAVNTAELEEYANLPMLEGPAGTEELVAQRLHDFTAWFKPIGRVPEAVALSNRFAWSVTLDDGLSVEIGREQDANTLAQRIARFVSTFEQVQKRWGGELQTADLRYPNGYAVRVAGVKFVAPKTARNR